MGEGQMANARGKNELKGTMSRDVGSEASFLQQLNYGL
jgi:hypothetical protein